MITGKDIGDFLEKAAESEKRISFNAVVRSKTGKEMEIQGELIPQKGFCLIEKEKNKVLCAAIPAFVNSMGALRYITWSESPSESLKRKLFLNAEPFEVKKMKAAA